MFLTRCGVPFCQSQKTGDGAPTRSNRADALAGQFAKVLKALGLKRRGLNFYAARHVFRTHAGAVPDPESVCWIMGHSLDGSAEFYA